MPSQNANTERARAETRQILAQSASFQKLEPADQLDLYRRMVESRAQELARLSGGMAKKASDLINDDRHKNERIDQAGELAGEFVNEVDFPGFVKDLLKGVFDANLKVTLDQMTAYQQLLKTATASVSKFVNAIDDTAAFGYLAENSSDEFSLDFGDETEEDGSRKAVLTDKDGNKLDLGDNELKARIMDAKIAMAKEQRAMLREVILMGVTRLVVEKGVVKAAVVFDIKASEKVKKNDKAALQQLKSKGGSLAVSGGLLGSLIGGPSGGGTWSNRESKISVSSAKSESSTDLAAKITGSVEINFKTDYFKLDNFATMYGPVTQADRAAAGPAAGGAAPALPPGVPGR